MLGDDELPEPPQPPRGGGEQPEDGQPESDQPESDQPASDEPASDEPASDQPEGDQPQGPGADTGADGEPVPEDAPADPDRSPAPPPAAPGGETTERARSAYRPRLFTVDGVGQGSPGRRSRALGASGRRVGSSTGSGSLHLVETLRAAAERCAVQGPGDGPRAGQRVLLQPADLRTAVREGREANLLLFCVDASGSMAARRRMVQVKTAILSLLTDAYRRRDKVAMISFRGADAALVLPPTGSVEVAAALLDDLPAGGRTPLAEALLEAVQVLRRERLRDVRVRPLLIVVTDGRATSGADAVLRSRLAADHLAGLGVPSVVVDCEEGPLRMGLARTLAGHLRAEHVPMARVDASGLVDVVTGRVA